MLKNNKEREDYIRDDSNWEILEYSLTQAGTTPIHVKDHYYPKLRMRRLKGTNLIKIELLAAPMYFDDKPHYVEIGCKVFKDDGQLSAIYDLTVNQQITYLRDHKI